MRHTATTLALAAFLAAAAGCSRPAASAPAPTGTAPPPPAAAATVKPERKTLRRVIGQPGQIEAFQRVPVYAKIAGYVQELNVDIGDRVSRDQVIAVLRVPEQHEELALKKAQAEQVKAEVEQANQALKAAQARVETARELIGEAAAARGRSLALVKRWKSECQRLETAVRDRVLDRQTLEETRYQCEAAEAALNEVEAKVRSAEATMSEMAALARKAEADVAAAKARQAVAEADWRRVQALVDYTQVTAPFAGRVFQRCVDPGDYVAVGSGGAKGEPLFVLVQADPVRVFVDVPEGDAVWVNDEAGWFETDTLARVRVAALPGRDFAATVKRSSWALDPKTRTLRAEINIANPNGELRPGTYAHALIEVTHAHTWTLPASAVVVQADQAFCFRVEDGKARKMPVQVGLRDGGLVEIFRKQTQPPKPDEKPVWEEWTGQEEIVRNAAGVSDGQAVGK